MFDYENDRPLAWVTLPIIDISVEIESVHDFARLCKPNQNSEKLNYMTIFYVPSLFE
jgi:hypothetical protein